MKDKFKTFTGGIFETNCYLLNCSGGNLLVDAPDGADQAFADEKIDILFLTHGHFDHVIDAAKIQARHDCEILYHPETSALVETADAFKKYGFALEITPFKASRLVNAQKGIDLLGTQWDLLDVPGHCPGSLALYHAGAENVFSGDALFKESIGRSDLPGGDHALLLKSIRDQLFTLPDTTSVYPGHGGLSSIGHEKKHNPFLQ
ncbi:MAG: MBL fold metallo-hydrolase [Chthoniobacterales bacterium]